MSSVPDEADEKQAAIYRDRAEDYERLVRAEDADAALPRALAELVELRGARVLDVGCGTGRVSRILLGLGATHVTGVDRAPAMLDVARRTLAGDVARGALTLVEGDARALPYESSFDAAIAGWCFGHFRHWMPNGWRDEVERALDSMERAVRPGGACIVIETLGTGHTTPRTHAALDEYFALLEARGFVRRWIRTDYGFASVDEAATVLSAFFEGALVERVRREGWARVPECTGIWLRRPTTPLPPP